MEPLHQIGPSTISVSHAPDVHALPEFTSQSQGGRLMAHPSHIHDALASFSLSLIPVNNTGHPSIASSPQFAFIPWRSNTFTTSTRCGPYTIPPPPFACAPPPGRQTPATYNCVISSIQLTTYRTDFRQEYRNRAGIEVISVDGIVSVRTRSPLQSLCPHTHHTLHLS